MLRLDAIPQLVSKRVLTVKRQKRIIPRNTAGSQEKVFFFLQSPRFAGKQFGPLVQWSERPAHNGIVVGSNPTGPTINKTNSYQF